MLNLVTLLLAPAAAAMLALPFGIHVHSSPNGQQMRAVYLFHRTGEPIAMVAPDHAPPIAAEELEPIIWTVRDFVETSMPKSQGYDVTSMRFDEEALVAVRGAYVSICAIFRSASVSAIRRRLVRFIRDFEGRNEGRLGTWEDACQVATQAADVMSPLLAAA
jgi:hypothetical protein